LKKGISIQTLILGLIFLVVIIGVFSFLFMKSSDQAFDKMNASILDKKSSDILSEQKSYFGLQLYLPIYEEVGYSMLKRAIKDCHSECITKNKNLLCNYGYADYLINISKIKKMFSNPEEFFKSSEDVGKKIYKKFVSEEIIEFEYNQNGDKLKEEKKILFDGKEVFKNTTLYFYEYDDLGNILEEKKILASGITLSYLYDYDEKGNLIWRRHYDGIIEEWTYDEKGQVVKEEKILSRNNKEVIIFEYDSLGNKIKENKTLWIRDNPVHEQIFYYNYTYGKDNLIEKMIKTYPDKTQDIITYGYDMQNRKKSEMIKNKFGISYFYIYYYDEKGRVIKKEEEKSFEVEEDGTTKELKEDNIYEYVYNGEFVIEEKKISESHFTIIESYFELCCNRKGEIFITSLNNCFKAS
jgi:YD repeat-containing protein